MLSQPRPAKEMIARVLSQEQHDAKAAAEAQAYTEQKIANMAKKLKGEEARDAQGQAAAAALNAGAAARCLADAPRNATR